MPSRRLFMAFLAFSAALGWASSSAAQELPGEPTSPDEQLAFLKIRSSYSACLDAAGSGMPSMIRCNQDEYQYQDNRLNRIYKQLAAKLSSDGRKALQKDERGWIALKEQKCAIPKEPGQGDVLDAVTCAMTYTARRATYLEGRLAVLPK